LWDGYRKVDFPFKKIISPEFKMIIDWTKEDLFNYLTTWSAYKRYIEDTHNDLKIVYFDRLSKIWSDNFKVRINMDFVFYSRRKQ
jgi:hypothetical protein